MSAAVTATAAQPFVQLVWRRYLARSGGLWIIVRLIASTFAALASGSVIAFSLESALIVVAITALLGAADVYRRHERALLENLGVSRLHRALLFATPAVLGESCIAVAAALIR